MPDVAVDAARFLAERVEEPIRLADVADHVGYSPFHLARTFERRFGVPPGQWVAAQRFQRAKRLLLTGDDRIGDVCCAVGFSSVGTFTRRFTAAVGLRPTEFRRLPDVLTQAPPEPVVVPGPERDGAVVTGTVRVTAPAAGALGADPAVYVGLFGGRMPHGVPVAGALLDRPGRFALPGVPAGRFWVLATALPGRDPVAQLLPERAVVGGSSSPVRLSPDRPSAHRDLVVDLMPSWNPPVLVALPPLANGGGRIAQDRRRPGAPAVLP